MTKEKKKLRDLFGRAKSAVGRHVKNQERFLRLRWRREKEEPRTREKKRRC